MARDKRKKFVELAERRTTKAIYALRLVGNLSNTNNYEYTDTDVKKIVKALEEEVKNMRRRFGEGTGSGEPVFKL